MSDFKQRLTDNANNFDSIVADMLEQIFTLQAQVDRYREALENIKNPKFPVNAIVLMAMAEQALKEKP